MDPGTGYHVSNYATANIMVQPTIRYMFGAEYIYGSLERKDDFKWIAPRLQASIIYYINKYPRNSGGRMLNFRVIIALLICFCAELTFGADKKSLHHRAGNPAEL